MLKYAFEAIGAETKESRGMKKWETKFYTPLVSEFQTVNSE